MLLVLIGQCQTKHIERNLSFDGFWTRSVLPDHWRNKVDNYRPPKHYVLIIKIPLVLQY